MANEYLKRTPTSTGNRKVWTWSGWVKKNELSIGFGRLFEVGADISNRSYFTFRDGDELEFDHRDSATITDQIISDLEFRDPGSFAHFMIAANSTASTDTDRIKIYVNGILLTRYSTSNFPTINQEFDVNSLVGHYLGNSVNLAADFMGSMTDVFLVDGQALTPDVFGKYDEGKGYISAGTSQATDFKKGQWIPKAPAIIKSVINARGGFGVNGFYLPMNSSNNFGADFHTTPNSILKLKENLPQPKAEIDGAGDYTNALRDDPFKDYLVLAIPGVSGGLQNGFGDYSAAIRGSGIAKSITNSNVSIASTASYYGSAASFNGTSGILTTSSNTDFYFTGAFTIECWVNWNGTATYYQNFIGCNKQSLPFNNNAAFFRVWGTSAPDTSIRSRIGIGNPTYDGSGSTYSGSVTLPTNQWTHVAATRDSTNTMRVFMNGVCVGIKTSDTTVYDFSLEGTAIGQGPWDGAQGYYSGLIQDLRVYKGIAKYKGGFDVPKPYTPVNFANWRAVPDTCQNNFATLNPLKSGMTLSDGNLKATSTGYSATLATIGAKTGKYYYEGFVQDVGGTSFAIGVGFSNTNTGTYGGAGTYDIVYTGPLIYGNSTNLQTGLSSPATGDTIGVALNLDSSVITFYKNGVQITSQNLTSGIEYFPCVADNSLQGTVISVINFGQNPTFSGNTTAGTFTDSNGKGLFKYEPPSGFLALCEDNLPTPTIKDPGEHFKTVLWTGDGNVGRSITGVGFQPDFVWIKPRNFIDQHVLCDSIRGPLKSLYIQASGEAGNGVLGFNADGFTLNNWNNTNDPNDQYVAWCWKAGGPAVTNTDGTITSQVSANQDAGFSIVSFTMPSGTYTVGHGLGKTPKFIITKQRDGNYGWWTQHASIGLGTAYLELSSPNGSIQLSWGGVPNSSTFTINNSYAIAGQRVIAYCWAEIEGFSKFGSYVGNGSADGPFVYCGFKPAFVLIKGISGTRNWRINDSSRSPINPVDKELYPNLTNTESTFINQDFLSNGFKIRTDQEQYNTGGVTYIFIAFAESPFQTANAK